MATKKTKKSQVRSADPEAIRATVYMPDELHAAMTAETAQLRKERKATREQVEGPKQYQRITMSAVIVEACQFWLVSRYAKTAKPKRKAA